MRSYADSGFAHHGAVLVAPNAYPRDRANRAATLGRMVTALGVLLADRPTEAADSFVSWLRDP